jgi:hypothetical protein
MITDTDALLLMTRASLFINNKALVSIVIVYVTVLELKSVQAVKGLATPQNSSIGRVMSLIQAAATYVGNCMSFAGKRLIDCGYQVCPERPCGGWCHINLAIAAQRCCHAQHSAATAGSHSCCRFVQYASDYLYSVLQNCTVCNCCCWMCQMCSAHSMFCPAKCATPQ